MRSQLSHTLFHLSVATLYYGFKGQMLYNNLKNSFNVKSYVGCQVFEEVTSGALVELCSAWVLEHPGIRKMIDGLED